MPKATASFCQITSLMSTYNLIIQKKRFMFSWSVKELFERTLKELRETRKIDLPESTPRIYEGNHSNHDKNTLNSVHHPKTYKNNFFVYI